MCYIYIMLPEILDTRSIDFQRKPQFCFQFLCNMGQTIEYKNKPEKKDYYETLNPPTQNKQKINSKK